MAFSLIETEFNTMIVASDKPSFIIADDKKSKNPSNTTTLLESYSMVVMSFEPSVRTGASWSLVGAEAVLRLRALRASGDFEDYWPFHLEREHERNHLRCYANGQVPSPLPVLKPRLRRVK